MCEPLPELRGISRPQAQGCLGMKRQRFGSRMESMTQEEGLVKTTLCSGPAGPESWERQLRGLGRCSRSSQEEAKLLSERS